MFVFLKEMLLASVVAAVLGFGTGYYTAHRFDQTTALTLQLKQAQANAAVLQDVINKQRAALEIDAKKTEEDSKKIADLERTADALKSQVSNGIALTADDTQRLLEWWNRNKDRPANPARKRAK